MKGAAATICLVLMAGCTTEPTDGPDPVVLSNEAITTRGPCGDPCDVTLAFDNVTGLAQLSFWILWDTLHGPGPNATLQVPDGNVYPLERGYRAARLYVSPDAGTYRLQASPGIPVQYGVIVEAMPQGDDDVLPNLVNLIPSDVHRETPLHELEGERIDAGDGCASSEMADDGARRCLRLGNAIGNVGPGNIELRMSAQEGATGITGEGRFRQVIERADGSTREALVGQATFHRIHQHWHYGGLQNFYLYQYDVTTGTRGPPVNDGHKAGFCLEDRALIEGHHGVQRDNQYDARYCTYIGEDMEDWYFGVTPGWYDLYWSELSSQYIEISGVPDGTYELVATLGTNGIYEVTEWDNSASVVIDLQGKAVDILEEHGWYRVAS